jgi:hypothetical protein
MCDAGVDHWKVLQEAMKLAKLIASFPEEVGSLSEIFCIEKNT